MAGSNVRNVESLEAFHAALLRLSARWDRSLQEVRMTIQRAEEYFGHDRPHYWRRQLQLAEQELNEAQEDLARKRLATRSSDRPPATEATQRVHRAERRLQQCEAKRRLARQWALEVSRHCEDVLGPLADAVDRCQTQLPAAAGELRGLVDQLRQYLDQLTSLDPAPGRDASPGEPGGPVNGGETDS